jgi:hypothetical protein
MTDGKYGKFFFRTSKPRKTLAKVERACKAEHA